MTLVTKNEISKIHPLMPIEYDWNAIEPIAKELYGKDCTKAEWELFKLICLQTELNPAIKQIYFLKVQGKMVVHAAIDGLRVTAERTRRYSPGKESTFTYDKDGKLISATSYVKKLTDDGTWHEVSHTCFMCEFQKKGKDGKQTNWDTMPHVMLSKCAEASALRRAFPEKLSKVYIPEEMDQVVTDIIEAEIIEKTIITEEEWAKLDALIEEFGDRERINNLAKMCNAPDIYSIQPKDYERVVRAIEKKLAEKKNGSKTS